MKRFAVLSSMIIVTCLMLGGVMLGIAATDANFAEQKGLSPLSGSTSITTLGTIATGVWHGTAVPVAYGGTGATTAAAARSALGVANNVTSGTLVAIPLTNTKALGDTYITTDSGTEAAYVCVKLGADTTGWSKVSN